MVKVMDKERIPFPMETNTLVNLKMIILKDVELLPMPMETLKKVYGKMTNLLRQINL